MKRIIKTRNYRNMPYMIYSLVISVVFTVILSTTVSASNMDASIYLKPSLTLSIPTSTVNIDLDPGSNAFSSQAISIEVGTNNSNGYKLYVSTADDSTDLVSTIDSTNTIPTLPSTDDNDCSSGCLEADFPANYWGYKLNTGNYIPFTSGAIVSSSSTPVNSNITTMTIGAKVDYAKPSGVYQTNLSFNTIPTVAMHYMQDLQDPTLAQRICTTDAPTMVMDKRDEHPYYIRRLADGKCWMVQNLRLGENLAVGTGSMTLSNQDSNVGNEGFILTNKVAAGDVMPYIEIEDETLAPTYYTGKIWDESAFQCNQEYGCFYNNYTATAGSNTSSTDETVNTLNSICPKGWRLPTGSGAVIDGTHSDYWFLVEAYNRDPMALLVNPTTDTENYQGTSAPGFTLGGYYATYGPAQQGAIGNYWTATNRSQAYSHSNYFKTNQIDINVNGSKAYARSVRCILQE